MASKSSIAHISDAPTVEITDNIAHERSRSGGASIVHTMSVKALTKYVERATRALERYARGEQNVIVDD